MVELKETVTTAEIVIVVTVMETMETTTTLDLVSETQSMFHLTTPPLQIAMSIVLQSMR